MTFRILRFYNQITMKINRDRIDYELTRLGWNIPKLAQKAEVSKQWIYHVLSDGKDVRLSTIQKIADALGINAKDLII